MSWYEIPLWAAGVLYLYFVVRFVWGVLSTSDQNLPKTLEEEGMSDKEFRSEMARITFHSGVYIEAEETIGGWTLSSEGGGIEVEGESREEVLELFREEAKAQDLL